MKDCNKENCDCLENEYKEQKEKHDKKLNLSLAELEYLLSTNTSLFLRANSLGGIPDEVEEEIINFSEEHSQELYNSIKDYNLDEKLSSIKNFKKFSDDCDKEELNEKQKKIKEFNERLQQIQKSDSSTFDKLISSLILLKDIENS